MSISIVLPPQLHEAVGASVIRVKAKTIRAAFQEAYRKVPPLKVQLCKDDGGFRPHVLCFLNGRNTHSLDIAVEDGDEIEILQAVSGG